MKTEKESFAPLTNEAVGEVWNSSVTKKKKKKFSLSKNMEISLFRMRDGISSRAIVQISKIPTS